MKNYKILKLELVAIIKDIEKYTSEPNISVSNKELIDGLNTNNIDFDIFEFCCNKISNWYDNNINNIIDNSFVFNKKAHTQNRMKIKEIIKDIQCNKNEYEKFFSTLLVQHEKPLKSGSDIFIVHGHDDGIKNEVARFLEKLRLKPIILHEQASSGDTIIEKIERYSNVGFGIVIYTPCDKGGLFKERMELNFRARQNVVFEHGYLMGKLGRKNVVALVKSDIEKPNDISGFVYISYDTKGGWQTEIAKELDVAGYSIDFNSLFK